MTTTTTAPNNKSVTFRGKPERELADHKPPRTHLRKEATRMRKRGLISDRAAKKLGMDD